ncbi:hypothetical protein [Fontivita pretiosa]|uniref:hypothetical protein n=1 Tax=Fontivita pretiosa TaxID=2989684 RepID=UPI003D169675
MQSKATGSWSWTNWSAGAVCGLLLAMLVGAAANGGGQPGRYQLHVWSTRGSEAGPADHGAYRIDSATGEVWAISANNVASRIEFK